MRLKWIVAAVAALALAWTVLNLGEPPWAHDTTLEACGPDAKPASLDFTLKNAEDVAVNLAQYKGKVVLLDFWATWCGPCKVEIPWFVEFQERYGSQGFQVVGVSVDDTAELSRVAGARPRRPHGRIWADARHSGLGADFPHGIDLHVTHRPCGQGRARGADQVPFVSALRCIDSPGRAVAGGGR
jgi:thiol-disulfide isomerase/thioredoxin